jgi:hypothetical protein
MGRLSSAVSTAMELCIPVEWPWRQMKNVWGGRALPGRHTYAGTSACRWEVNTIFSIVPNS